MYKNAAGFTTCVNETRNTIMRGVVTKLEECGTEKIFIAFVGKAKDEERKQERMRHNWNRHKNGCKSTSSKIKWIKGQTLF